MTQSINKIGIIIETENGSVKETNFGMITLANRGNAELFALMGENTDAADALAKYGITTVVDLGLPEEPNVRLNPDVRAKAVVAAVNELGLDGVFGLSSAEGKDLIPRVAAYLDAPLVMDCLDVDLETKTGKTSQYSGKVVADIQLTGDITVFGIRPNAVKGEPAAAEATTASLAAADTSSNLALVSWDESSTDDSQVSLSEADIIVAGGRGLKNGENFSLLFDCADKMKAAVGASRVAVDEGWVAYAHQVGQTGEKVSPSVYIACGISGSIQHFAGMKTSKMIIAVNTDENAAMVANSDYYVLGDLFEILPEIIKQI
ncbi:MAG: electron transfer flavoprotein subunit alpha/FixB family protein [Desulfobacterales bacterium]|nr:electron transfer flavoprotein subunit alpha/FixB family protein [Desulfobacterales bacterium]